MGSTAEPQSQEHKYGQPYGESEMSRSLSSTHLTQERAFGQSSGTPNQGFSEASSQEHKYGQPYGESDMHQQLSAPQQARQDFAPSAQYGSSNAVSSDSPQQTQGQGTGVVEKVMSAVGMGSSNTEAEGQTFNQGSQYGSSHTQEQGAGMVDRFKSAVGMGSSAEPELQASNQGFTQEHKYGQPYGDSEMFQRLSMPQQGNQYGGSSAVNTGSSEGQDRGVVDKLKSAVGMDTSSTEQRSNWSSKVEPAYESDNAGSGASTQFTTTRSTIQTAPPSASWGTSKYTYEPAAAAPQGGYTSSAAGGEAATGSQGAYSDNVADSGSYQGSPPAQAYSAILGRESPVKSDVSGAQGRDIGQTSQGISTGTPKGLSGMQVPHVHMCEGATAW